MQRSVYDAQKYQPSHVTHVGDIGFYFFEMGVECHRSACAEKAHTGKEDLAAEVPAVDLEFLVAEFDQGIGQGPSDHDKHGKKHFETVIL